MDFIEERSGTANGTRIALLDPLESLLDPWANISSTQEVESVCGGPVGFKASRPSCFRFFFLLSKALRASDIRVLRYPIGLVVVSASPHRPGYSSSKF